MKHSVLVLVFCLMNERCFADTPEFEYEMALIDGEVMRGEESLWRFTMTNTGDTPVALAYFGTHFWEYGGDPTLMLLPSVATSPCVIAYDDLFGEQGVLVTATSFMHPFPIAPGESRSCDVSLYMQPYAPSQFTQWFTFGAIDAVNEVTTKSFSHYFVLERPTAIPAWSRFASLITAVLVLGAGGMALLRSR